MKKFIKAVKEIITNTYYEMVGYPCAKCGKKHSVFYYEHILRDDKWQMVYKCRKCEVEGIRE